MGWIKTAAVRTSLASLVSLTLLATQGCAGVPQVSYRGSGGEGRALLCRPEGKGPFPVVVYNHGLIVDRAGYQSAAQRGYNLDGICRALAADGFLAFAPIRKSGTENIPGHKDEVSRAIDYVKTLPDADPARVGLMGFSRGGLLTFLVGLERTDLKALLILAPAPGAEHFASAVKRVPSLNAPVLLLVEASDDRWILDDFDLLEKALRKQGKELRAVRYDRGGGHRLFYDVGYYWADVRAFLREKLRGNPSR